MIVSFCAAIWSSLAFSASVDIHPILSCRDALVFRFSSAAAAAVASAHFSFSVGSCRTEDTCDTWDMLLLLPPPSLNTCLVGSALGATVTAGEVGGLSASGSRFGT